MVTQNRTTKKIHFKPGNRLWNLCLSVLLHIVLYIFSLFQCRRHIINYYPMVRQTTHSKNIHSLQINMFSVVEVFVLHATKFRVNFIFFVPLFMQDKSVSRSYTCAHAFASASITGAFIEIEMFELSCWFISQLSELLFCGPFN